MGFSESQRLHETAQGAKFGMRNKYGANYSQSRKASVDSSAYNGGVLTNEDKQWFEENTRRLTERLEHLIEENIRRITERLEQRFTEQLAEHQRDLSGKIERVETTLLTEFHKWASPLEMRQRSHAAAIRALDA